MTADLVAGFYVTVRIGTNTAKAAFLSPPGIPLWGCLTAPANQPFEYISWIPAIFFQAMFCILSLWKLFQSAAYRDETSSWKWIDLRHFKDMSPLFVLFVRDGTIYFLFSLTSLLLSLVLTMWGPAGVTNAVWPTSIIAIAQTRLLLNLRVNQSTDYNSSNGNTQTGQSSTFVAIPMRVLGRNQTSTEGSVSTATHV
ncbi:hypothetical protein D9758_018903 [Tetrapyrgos nigripes]|uniref:Uncharacterized protein n=1 Tax=Tetrapyrgos nigripes TaxID=182062 RepID=A0A8H5BAK2_9AGAR|nr:hypothetical protein D9758_018903 [Tetrapyrgos nigripes]